MKSPKLNIPLNELNACFMLEEFYEELPKREGMKAHLAGEWDRYGRSSFHRVGGYFPSDIVDRVLLRYANKQFDRAFKYYCALVPKYQQDEFLSIFDTYRWWRLRDVYTEDGIIKHIKRKRNKEVGIRLGGIMLNFSSKNDYRYRRIWHENMDRIRKDRRENNKALILKVYNFNQNLETDD